MWTTFDLTDMMLIPGVTHVVHILTACVDSVPLCVACVRLPRSSHLSVFAVGVGVCAPWPLPRRDSIDVGFVTVYR